MFDSIRETIDYSVENNISFADMMINDEMEREGKSREEVRDLMRQNLNVMREAVEKGTTGDGVESVTGYTGHDAAKLRDYNENNHALSGHEMIDAVKGAVATNEVNAAMGIICATPTAGSSGTIPGVIFKLEKTHNITEDQMIDFLFTSALFGRVVANNASVAGATGGCQAEVGSASAMAAARHAHSRGPARSSCPCARCRPPSAPPVVVARTPHAGAGRSTVCADRARRRRACGSSPAPVRVTARARR